MMSTMSNRLAAAAALALAGVAIASVGSASARTGSPIPTTALEHAVTKVGPVGTPDKVYIYGHSFTMGPDDLTGPYPYSGYVYGSLIGAHYGVPKDFNGRSGARLLDTVRMVTSPSFEGTTARAWQVGNGNSGHIVTLENGMNDMASVLGGDADYQDGYTLALRLALATFGAGSRTLAADAASETPRAWTSVAYPDRAPGGAMSYTKVPGARMNFTTTSTDVTIATTASDPSITYGTMALQVDGQTVDTYNGTGRSETYADRERVVRSWTEAGVHLTLSPGKHTVSVVKADGDPTRAIFVSAIYQGSSTPAHVFLGMEPDRNPNGSGGEVFAGNSVAFHAIWTAACAEWPHVRCVDLQAAVANAPAWDNRTMVATSAKPKCPGVDCGKEPDAAAVHPNGLGMVNIAEKFEAAIDAS